MGPGKGTGQGQASPDHTMPIPFPADESYNETEAKLFLQFYDQTAQVVLNQFMEAAWNYVTNITKKNREDMVWYHLAPVLLNPLALLRGLGGWGRHFRPPFQS